MNIVLSRLQLNPLSARALSLAGDVEKMHETVYRLFEKESSGRILYRVDQDNSGPVVLIQSSAGPDWSRLILKESDLRSEPASKALVVNLAPGSELGFRLLARAQKASGQPKAGTRLVRRDLRTDEERMEWLKRKSETAGFRVSWCSLTSFSFPAIKSGGGARSNATFSAVRFDGELVVTHSELFISAIQEGFGTQKAYGFGLLSLGRM